MFVHLLECGVRAVAASVNHDERLCRRAHRDLQRRVLELLERKLHVDHQSLRDASAVERQLLVHCARGIPQQQQQCLDLDRRLYGEPLGVVQQRHLHDLEQHVLLQQRVAR